MSICFVRSLWGEPRQDDLPRAGFAKVAWEIDNLAHSLPEACDVRIICYGEYAGNFLSQRRIMPSVVLPDEVPDWYCAMAPAGRRMTARRGKLQQGMSRWWHKLHAIKTAFDTPPNPSGLIWLDWDATICRQPDADLFSMLEDGPAFQGCIRVTTMALAFWREGYRRRLVYNGGAYYIRSENLIDKIIERHAKLWCGCSDETAVTHFVETDLDDSTACNNHRFFCSSRAHGIEWAARKRAGSASYFTEGGRPYKKYLDSLRRQ